MAKIVCDPVTRLEGHLGVEVNDTGAALGPFPKTVAGDVKVFSTMYRGFENILKGRDPRDAIQITQRICGVCPVPHGTAATFALENAMGFSPEVGTHTGHSSGPNNVSRLVRNLTLGGEFMMSALTHFYALSALDLVQGPEEAPWTPFWNDSYYDPALLNGGSNINLQYQSDGSPTNIYTAVITDYVLALRNRTAALDMGAIFGGRLPVSSSYVAGGTTKLPTHADIVRAKELLTGVTGFITDHYIPMTEIVSALHGLADNTANNWYVPLTALGLQTPGAGKRGPYSCVEAIQSGVGLGAGCKNFYSAGGFDQAGNLDGSSNTLRLFPRGAIIGASDSFDGNPEVVDATNIRESIKNSHYKGAGTANENLYPGLGVTNPDPTVGYTWHKATRYSATDITSPTAVKEVGPLARMWVAGYYKPSLGTLPMSKHAFAATTPHPGAPLPDLSIAGYRCGVSVMDRHRARAREALLIAQSCLAWLNELDAIVNTPGWELTTAGKRFTTAPKSLAGLTAEGFGMAEAPRGSVHHWTKVVNGKIANYQIIAPTTWNCSGRDSSDHLGPVEQALAGAPLRGVLSDGKNIPVEALIVVHSFDPCIACSVHMVDPEVKTNMNEFIVEGV